MAGRAGAEELSGLPKCPRWPISYLFDFREAALRAVHSGGVFGGDLFLGAARETADQRWAGIGGPAPAQ